MTMVNDLSAGGLRQAGQHAQQSGFAGTGWAQHRQDFARIDGQIGGRDHLHAALALRTVGLLNLACFDDGFHAGGGLSRM